MTMPNLLTIQGAADKIGVSRVAIFNMIRRGEINAIRPGHAYLIPEKNLVGIEKRDQSEIVECARRSRTDRQVSELVSEFPDKRRLTAALDRLNDRDRSMIEGRLGGLDLGDLLEVSGLKTKQGAHYALIAALRRLRAIY